MANITDQEQNLNLRGEEGYAGSLETECYTLSNQPKCWSIQKIQKASNEQRPIKRPINQTLNSFQVTVI